MQQQILELVKKKHISSGGSCGIRFVDLQVKLNLQPEEFEALISEMYNDEKIDIRIGINGFLVMKKNMKL
ncbi:hypothetical protein AAIP58_000077 [Flavobacterium psychrophilum]|nr:hypothetical protein [Flavobacterium psychrophilum]